MAPCLPRISAAAAVILLLAASLPSQYAPSSSESVWFAMSEADHDRIVLDPVTKVRNGKLLAILNGCNDNDPEYKQFAAQYLAPNRSYWVTFRGAPAGRATLEGHAPVWEDGVAARYDGPILIHGNRMALASSRSSAGNNHDLTRSPTPIEQAAAVDYAKIQFAKAGLPHNLLAAVSAEQTEIESFRDGKEVILIGSFSAEDPAKPGVAHALFLIAALKGKQTIPQFVWSRISRDEKDNQTLDFVDKGDLFGDHQEEFVLRISYYKNYRYRVLQQSKKTHQWEQIFESDILGCE